MRSPTGPFRRRRGRGGDLLAQLAAGIEADRGTLPGLDFAQLAARAESQLDRLAPHRRRAARTALAAATAAAGS